MKCKEMEARKKRKWNEAKRTGQGAKGELHTLSSTALGFPTITGDLMVRGDITGIDESLCATRCNIMRCVRT